MSPLFKSRGKNAVLIRDPHSVSSACLSPRAGTFVGPVTTTTVTTRCKHITVIKHNQFSRRFFVSHIDFSFQMVSACSMVMYFGAMPRTSNAVKRPMMYWIRINSYIDVYPHHRQHDGSLVGVVPKVKVPKVAEGYAAGFLLNLLPGELIDVVIKLEAVLVLGEFRYSCIHIPSLRVNLCPVVYSEQASQLLPGLLQKRCIQLPFIEPRCVLRPAPGLLVPRYCLC